MRNTPSYSIARIFAGGKARRTTKGTKVHEGPVPSWTLCPSWLSLCSWFRIDAYVDGRFHAANRILLAVVLVLIVLVPRLLSRSAAPAEGSAAPDFTLPSQEGSSVSLKDYRGKWVVLYFYPKDQTPGCTREAHNFQVDQPKFSERNAVVLGVSLDSVDSHKKFCAKEGLNFKLLADTEHDVTASYGSLLNFGVVKVAKRHTFLIDPTGKIAKAYTSVDPLKHSSEVSSGTGCSAKVRQRKSLGFREHDRVAKRRHVIVGTEVPGKREQKLASPRRGRHMPPTRPPKVFHRKIRAM